MIDPEDDDARIPYRPPDPGEIVVWAWHDHLLAQDAEEEEARRAERRAWLTENHGWPPQ